MKYQFLQDYTAVTANASLGPDAPTITRNFIGGDVIDGIIIQDGFVSTNTDGSLPNEGEVGQLYFGIPINILVPFIEEPKATIKEQGIFGGTVTILNPTKKQAREILIMAVILVAIYGGLKYFKVI